MSQAVSNLYEPHAISDSTPLASPLAVPVYLTCHDRLRISLPLLVDGAFEQGFADGMKNAHPRLPARLEDIEDALAAFEEHLMEMEFQRLGVDEEMKLGREGTRLQVLREEEEEGTVQAWISQWIDAWVGKAAREVASSSTADETEAEAEAESGDQANDDGQQLQSLLSEWEQNALAAASAAPENYFSSPVDPAEDWRPSVRKEEKKSGRGPGPTVPTLYRRSIPKKRKPTHPNSIGAAKEEEHGVRGATAASTASSRTRGPTGRQAGYASKRVVIDELRKKETLHERRARLTRENIRGTTVSRTQNYAHYQDISSETRRSARAAATTVVKKQAVLKKRWTIIRHFMAPRMASSALERRKMEEVVSKAKRQKDKSKGEEEGDSSSKLEIQKVAEAAATALARTTSAAAEESYKKHLLSMFSKTTNLANVQKELWSADEEPTPLSGPFAQRMFQILNQTREKIKR